MMDIRGTIAARMAKRREELGLTLSEASQRMTTSRPSISRYAHWETGNNSPKLELLPEIAAALQMSPAYLCGFSNDRDSGVGSIDLFSRLPAASINVPGGAVVNLDSDKSLAFSQEALTPRGLREHQLILLKAHDNSMGNEVAAGDLVLVNRDEAVPVELDIFAVLVKNRVWFRWIRPEMDGSFTVFAEDDGKYPPVKIEGDKLSTLCIIGRAVSITRFR